MVFCNNILTTRSKYARVSPPRCHCQKGHPGSCEEFPFLSHLRDADKALAEKIKRDATMTTGAAWKSSDAGPNRILRWVMKLPDEELLSYGIDMTKLKPGVVAKLREKAADYDSCVLVAAKLTWMVYQMKNAPLPPDDVKEYLEDLFGPMTGNSTVCVVCKLPLDYRLFAEARRGSAAIETCHKNPRLHNPDNVGFGHRECNIAQGTKTLSDFYAWIQDILSRVSEEEL